MNKGLKAYTTLIQHNLGNNFTTYVNLNKEDANMHVIVPLLSTSGINGFHTSLIFNLLYKDQKGIFGKGFKLNFYSRLDDLETKIIIKNADGSIDEFLKENNYYNKEVCAKITKVVDSSSVTGYHYELIFNDNTVKYYRSNEEYPYMIKDSKNNILFIEYMLNGDLLIKNELNDEIHFKLVNDGYVSHVKYYQDGEVISTVELRYYDEKLDSIGYFINNVTKTNSMINYSSEYIELIKDDGKNLLKLVFEEGKVKQIFKGKNQIYKDTPLNTIIYHDEYTELINSKSEKNYYFFDNNNLLLYVLDYNGKIFKVKHDLYSKKIIKRSSILPVVNKTQNLLPSNDIRNFENHNLEITEVEAESTLFSEILNDSLFKINSSGNTFQNLIYNLENDYSSSEQVVLLVWIRRISNYDLDNKVTIKLGLDDIEFDREHLTNGLSTSIYTPIVLVAKPKDFYNNINITIFVEGITEFEIGGIQLLHKNIGENITYNEDGNIIERITNKGYERYVYNDDKLLSKVIFNDKIIKSYTYDESKNISLSKEENHAKSVKKYSNKVKSNVTYERRENYDKSKVIEKTIEYSNDNRFIKKFKQNSGNETGIEFDKNGKLTKIIDALGREKHFIYNELEYLEQILLKKGNSIINKIIYDYDSENRIKEIELFNGSIYSLEYDENDNISKISLNNEILSIFEYDDENEEVSVWFGEKAYKNDEGVNVSGSDGWHYKFENGMISEVNKISIFNVVMPLYKYIYNSDYNLEKVLDNTNSNLSDDEKTVIEEYIYDSNGFLKEVIKDNSTINYSYDSEGILTSKEYVINGTQRNTQYVYSGWPKMASIYDFHTNSATKDSYIGTFNKNAILVYGDEKLCPIGHNDNIASQVPSKLGIIPYLSISEANPLTYKLEMPNYYLDDSGCVQFWFYPEKNENNEEKYLISLRDINNAGSIEVYLKDNEVYLKLVEVSNVSDQEIIRLKENIKTNVEIKYDSWNFFSFSFLNKCDGQGYPDVGEYYIRVNDKELTFSNNYPDEVRYCIPLGTAPKFNIGHNYDGTSVKGCLNAKIGFLSITPRKYLSPTEIDVFYEYTKQYFEQEEGNNYNFSVSNTTFSGSDDSFSVYKLQKTFNSTKNNKSKKFINRSNKEIENTDSFEYDEKNKNYVYVAKGNDLIYDFGQSKSGTIVMKSCIDVINEYQYFFEGEDENGNNLSLYRKEDEYLYIKYNNTEIATNLLFTTSEYHTIAFSFNEQIIASSQSQNTKLQVRLKLDDETFNTTISDTYELASFTFSIGKKKTNNTKKMLRNENNTYPLNGKIETIATSVAFCEEDTLNSLISSLDGITTTKTYDELGILQGKTIHHNGNNIISNSYSYYLDENSNVISTVPEFEFIKYKSTDGTDEKLSIIYQYDELGRLIRYIIAGQVSYDYTYDDNGFISVVEESTNYVDSNFTDITETTYSYDSNGNILRKSTELSNIYSYGSTSETDNYTYEGEKLVSYNTNQIRYDSSKPMFISSYNGVSYTYEADRLKSFTVGGRPYYLHYDDAGRRIKKLNYQNVGSEYFYDGNLLIKEINPEYTLDFLYDEYNELYGFVKDNSEEYFYIRDYFKNILAITNKSGEIVVKYKYDAFGKFTISGDLATTIGKINPFKYKGYYYDNETNLFLVTSRYYNPELGRFIQPADVSSLNPLSINGLNLYSYANNNPIGIVYSNSSVGGTTSSGMVNTIRSSMGNSIINNDSYNNYVDLNFLGNFFAFNENIYSSIAGFFEGIRRRQGLGQYESLAKASKILMHVGYWLNVGLSAYNNYHDSSLTTQEKWVSFGVDTVYTTVVTVGAYFLGMIPYVGPFLAILVPIGVEYLWSGELSIFGFDIDVQPIKINGKTIEEWVKSWVNSWFE